MTQSAELVATVSWSAEKRKLNAVKACGERDGAALVGLLHAYVRAEEKKGFAPRRRRCKPIPPDCYAGSTFAGPIENSPHVFGYFAQAGTTYRAF